MLDYPREDIMKRVYSSADSLLTHHLRNILENAGIACQVRNEFLMGGAGDLPVLDVWPEIWVEDTDAERATALIQIQLQPDATAAKEWTCPECGTRCEGQFDACWNCGTFRTTD